MEWKKKQYLLQHFRLYAVTDLTCEDDKILCQVESACRGGADIVQLRSKTLCDAALYRLALKLRPIADRFETLLFINDRVDVALAARADGIHVGQDDLPVAVVRRLSREAGHKVFIGKSTHSLEQALAAEKEGPDYIGVGPIFGTPTKPGYSPVGVDLICRINAEIRIPWVVIGGIDAHNIQPVLAAGARRVAVVRAIFHSENIDESTQQLKDSIEKQVSLCA